MKNFSEKMVNDRLKLRKEVGAFCGDCYFWWVKDKGSGECRFLSPALIEPNTNNAVWPITTPFDWCGDFRHILSMLEYDDDDQCDGDCEHCSEGHEEYDKSTTLDNLRSSILNWKSKHPEGYIEIIEEIKKKNIEDAYLLIRTAVIYDVPFFDNLPHNTVTGEFIKLNKKLKSNI